MTTIRAEGPAPLARRLIYVNVRLHLGCSILLELARIPGPILKYLANPNALRGPVKAKSAQAISFAAIPGECNRIEGGSI